MSTNSQTSQILKYMKRYKRITPLDALSECGCFRLAARIHDLRKLGIPIITERSSRNGISFAQYRIAK